MIAQTDRAAGIVLADHDYVDNLLNTLPDAYQMLGRQGLYGDFFSFYLCDLVLKVNGKGRPAGVHQAGRPGTREVHAAMKSFAERNPFVVGAVGVGAHRPVVGAWLALNYDKLPFINQRHHYSAYFAEAAG